MARRPALSREKILDAAFALAAEEGVDGLSMRRLAKSLGVEAMSLYNHVAGKGDLLDAMAERVLGEVAVPDPALPWPERVRILALGMFHALRRHPVVPLTVATDQANPTSVTALRPLDALIGALYDAGFGDADARDLYAAITGLIYGSLVLSTAGFRVEDFFAVQGEEQVGLFARNIDAERLPSFDRMLRSMRNADQVQKFERGLDVLISGLEAAAPA